MKRTEMVILMQNALEKWQEENPNGGSFYDAMSFVLNEQEVAGISPPVYEEPCCPEEFKGTKLEGCYTAFITEWEDDDE